VELALAPLSSSVVAQKKGYALAPHFNVAPRDILLSVSEDNILLSKRGANHIIMELLADNPLTHSNSIHSNCALQWVAAMDNELQIWSVMWSGVFFLYCRVANHFIVNGFSRRSLTFLVRWISLKPGLLIGVFFKKKVWIILRPSPQLAGSKLSKQFWPFPRI
jgi:hypothetical protein